jgi:hypothetical protein
MTASAPPVPAVPARQTGRRAEPAHAGLSWVLPLHETVETFLAGVVFSVATNFILIGSTKILTVIVTYADILVGFPSRTVGGAGWRTLEDKAIAQAAATAPDEKPRPW